MAARLTYRPTAASLTGGGRFLLVALLLGFGGVAQAADTTTGEHERVNVLIRGGATQLAQTLIDRYQSDFGSVNTDVWIEWERQRLVLYDAQHDWAGLTARVRNLPKGVPPEFARWARTEAAQAELNAGHTDSARRLLGELLWSGAGSGDDQAGWRQLVIRSYLLDDNVGDAVTALERYRADYGVDSPAWRTLEATVLLRANRPRDAYLKVGEVQTHEGRLLSLLAALRSNILAPKVVLERAEALAEETRNKPVVQQQVWLLAAEASQRAANPERRIFALERALTLARQFPAPERLFTTGADNLWSAYEQFAETVGNDAHLLVGQDRPWLARAEAYKRDDAMQARAFYAFLTTHAVEADNRALATRRLTDSLVEDGRGEVLRALYTTSQRNPKLAEVPEYVRYRLTDLALADYDIAFAAQLMQGLETPPNGEDPEMWALRRARVLIYAGQYADAVRLLTRILDKQDKVGDALSERYLQVLFDLQAAKRHGDAIDLLDRLMQQVDNPRTQREILFWIAESKVAEGEYQQAAELYLRSATYQNSNGGDMWGQTARYHAAEALGKAGLTQDARLVFQALLKHTEDAKQRAVIERSIQQLWLIEKKTTTP